MENNLSALTVTRKSGNEEFRLNDTPTGRCLLDFWQWSGSDLTNNAFRGMLAEYIVACDLGVENGTRTEWDAHDLITNEGVKVEVKSCAYLQSWHQSKLSNIVFSIPPTMGWDASTNTTGVISKRQADVYVFCLLSHQIKSTLNPMDFNQWEFFVLPTEVLNAKASLQKTISLGSLLRLSPIRVIFGGIGKAIGDLRRDV